MSGKDTTVLGGTPLMLAGLHTRRHFLRRAAGIGLGVAGLLLLGSRIAAAQPLESAQDLFKRLLSTPIRPDEMPAGFKVSPPYHSTYSMQEIHPDFPGLVGATIVEIDGPDLTNTIWYYVFGSEAEALAHFENGEFGRATTSAGQSSAEITLTETYEPAGFQDPAWCVAAKHRQWGFTSCSVLVGNVEIVGFSRVLPGSGAQRGNDANAIALARAGAAHLRRLFV